MASEKRKRRASLELSRLGLDGHARYAELAEIVDLSFQVHGQGARAWLVRPEPELGFVLPVTLLRDPANGPKLVKQTLLNHLRGKYALPSR